MEDREKNLIINNLRKEIRESLDVKATLPMKI